MSRYPTLLHLPVAFWQSSLHEQCRTNGSRYARDARTVTHASGTGNWLLHAVARFRRKLDQPSPGGVQPSESN